MVAVALTHTRPELADTAAFPVDRLRIDAIDVLRGIVMILMALDHTRDYLGVTNVSPTDLLHTTVPLFFTRWVTHFCAPVFFLLTGTSAYLSLRTRSRRQLSQYLLRRGLWLILLELTLFRCLALQFNFDYHVTLLNVLWALGWAMIVLSLLVHLPLATIATFGVLLIVGHNMLDSIRASNPLWSILHAPNFVVHTAQHSVFVGYPLIPWIGVTATGFSLGAIYHWTQQRRKAFLFWLGLGLTGAFVILRATHLYGDPIPWTTQESPVFTALSFLNTCKYPPSLLFLLMTLGPALIFLGAVDGRTPTLLRPALSFGKVPMFYFLLHFVLIHLIAVVVCFLRYGDAHWMFESPSMSQFPVTFPPGWGFPLPVVYLLWIGVVFSLYPLCCWFAAMKQRRSGPLLSYL